MSGGLVPCINCQDLASAGPLAAPHEDLKEIGPAKDPETSYREFFCRACDREWTLQTDGAGWVW